MLNWNTSLKKIKNSTWKLFKLLKNQAINPPKNILNVKPNLMPMKINWEKSKGICKMKTKTLLNCKKPKSNFKSKTKKPLKKIKFKRKTWKSNWKIHRINVDNIGSKSQASNKKSLNWPFKWTKVSLYLIFKQQKTLRRSLSSDQLDFLKFKTKDSKKRTKFSINKFKTNHIR